MQQILSFKGWLVQNKVTQTELAKLLGISVQAVNGKVNGRHPFTMNQVIKICETYGVSSDIFLPEELRMGNKEQS